MRAAAFALVTALAVLLPAAAVRPPATAEQGPSSSRAPYLLGLAGGVRITALLTAGDAVGDPPYRMVGLPDGIGAFDNGDGTFTVLLNHELGGADGAQRAHGAAGAFVSKWVINTSTLAVQSGADLIRQVATWNTTSGVYNPPAAGVVLNRFCSADLAPVSAFYNAGTGLGYNGRIFMNGEEVGAEGRAFAHLLDGTSYELPRLGKFSWENSLANPSTGDKTVVIGTDDTSPHGQIYVYLGAKSAAGNPVERAGLTNGLLYGLQVTGLLTEETGTTLGAGAAFTLFAHGDVSAMTGAAIEAESLANGVTSFLRPEDGAWDPSDPSRFYFATTSSASSRSRLWRLRFHDLADPAAGGTIEMLLDGSEGQHMLDNLTVDASGELLLQEDPGGNDHVARIWRYSPATDRLTLIAEHDPALFTPGAPGFITNDEESTGILDLSPILGPGYYLFAVQIHVASADPELVAGGQLALLYAPAQDRTFLPQIALP